MLWPTVLVHVVCVCVLLILNLIQLTYAGNCTNYRNHRQLLAMDAIHSKLLDGACRPYHYRPGVAGDNEYCKLLSVGMFGGCSMLPFYVWFKFVQCTLHASGVVKILSNSIYICDHELIFPWLFFPFRVHVQNLLWLVESYRYYGGTRLSYTLQSCFPASDILKFNALRERIVRNFLRLTWKLMFAIVCWLWSLPPYPTGWNRLLPPCWSCF